MTSTFGVENLRCRRLRDVSLEIPAGSVTAVVGGAGAGKTTLLRVLAGGLKEKAGDVRRPVASQIGYVPTGGGVFPGLTAEENLHFVASVYGVDRDEASTRSGELLERTELAPFASRLASHLSGGQRQKLAMAMGLVHGPRLLVLDEPTTGVDPVSRAQLWRLIAASSVEGAAVVVATSYLDEAERASKLLVLDAGRVLDSGSPREIVARLPGRIVRLERPAGRRSWRDGRHWRRWVSPHDPTLAEGVHVQATLSDAVIVSLLHDEADDDTNADADGNTNGSTKSEAS